jgi:N-acetylated-alpha-linked acidic dipeptidase
MELQFDGPYGVYHSMYDDFYWMNRFGDPGYRYHALMSQVWGVLALRLANADVLPFDYEKYAHDIGVFVNELKPKIPAGAQLDLEPLQKKVAALESVARDLKQATNAALRSGKLSRERADRLNASEMQFESNWLNPQGIPGRPWFQHTLYAARYTYAHLELPGLTEAVEGQKWDLAREQAKVLEDAVDRNTQLLRRALTDLH